MIMQYCEAGDLNKVIAATKKSQSFLPEEKILKIFTQVKSSLLSFACFNLFISIIFILPGLFRTAVFASE
jgi:hypothetical protein